MNVYFVNRYSKLKGPFDIIDSNRQHIIKIGDICLRDTTEGVVFYVVYNTSNSWNSCKVVGIGDNDVLSDIGNTLLFSFDGLSRRKGDVALIKQIRLCFREKVIDDFFCNAVDILDYKKDFWDGSLFPQFFASSQELVERIDQKKPVVIAKTNRLPSVFAQYLSKELQDILTDSLIDGKELKEAYIIIREKHPDMFRKALMQFLSENPSGTIYDKPAESTEPVVVDLDEDVEDEDDEEEDVNVTSYDDKPIKFKEIEHEPLKFKESIERFIIVIGRYPMLFCEEEIELAQKVRKGDIDARNKLVCANLRFVVSLAKQYLHQGLEFEDLISEGILGLIKAAERFDETRGFAFMHYAPWWIRRYITDAIIKDSSLIQFPLSVQILHRKIWDLKVKYEHKNGFLPPITEIEVTDEDNLDRISFLDSLPNNLKNTCIPCEDLDVYEDNHNDIWDYDNNEYNKYYVGSLLARLSKRERDILIRVFGIGLREESLEMIGKSHGLTRERVRQIKEKTIKKLRDMIFAVSPEVQPVKNLYIQGQDSANPTATVRNTQETQTLKEVRMAFLQANFTQIAKAKDRMSDENTNVILPSSSKEVVLESHIYSVANCNDKCNIYDQDKNLVYSSTGNVKEINKSYYRVSLTFSFISIGLIKRGCKGNFFNGPNILLANRQSMLHQKLNCNELIDLIEDIEYDGRRRVKVDGCWYDERGNEVFENTNSDSIIIVHHDVKNESIDEFSTRKPEIPNEIDESGFEHVFVDTFDVLPYRDVEVATEQPNEDEEETTEEETPPIWTLAENIRFTKRSKQFLKCKCSVGLSKTGYYLIVNHRFIKLGDYRDGYECNVGNIWIKRPIDDRGYRMVHENDKGGHLIGYAIDKGKKIVFTDPTNAVYSVTSNGRIISGIKDSVSLKDCDTDKLRHAFDKKATSYKYFWFLAILNIYNENRKASILFKDILIVMVTIAWKYVFVENCEFPKLDQLPNYLSKIQEKSYLDRYAKESRVKETVQAHYHEWNWNTLLMPLLNNVPYRFLSPWIPFTNNEEVMAKSEKTESRCPYGIAKDHVTINPLWSDYIVENYDKISLFIEKELKFYLKCK